MLSRSAYRIVVVGLLLNMMGILTGLFSPGQSDTDLGVISNQLHLPVMLTTGCIYVLLFWNMISRPRRYLEPLSKNWPLILLLGFCTISACWSGDVSLTIRRALILLLTALAGVIIGRDFKIASIGRMLATASVLHLVLIAIFFVVGRHYLFAPEDPSALKGLTTHKNVFGFEAGLAVIVLAFCPFPRLMYLRWPLTLAAGCALIWSHSSGSLIATIAAIAIFPFLLVTKLNSKERAPLTVVVVVIATAFLVALGLNLQRIPALFSKDATLTGRTELWSLVLVAIRTHPWLGFGFDSFWRGLEGDSLTVIRGVGWLVPTAHNGYLDLLLSVGVVGAVLFAFVMLLFLKRSGTEAMQGSGSSRYLPLVFAVLLLVYNLNESALLTRSGLPFFLITAFMTSIGSARAHAYEAVSHGGASRVAGMNAAIA